LSSSSITKRSPAPQPGPLGTRPLELQDLVELTGFSLPELAEMARPGGVAANVDTAGLVTFCLAAKARGLDPRKRQCYYIQRGGRWTFQTGIDGFSAIAARTGRDGGISAPIFRGHLAIDLANHQALDVPVEVEVVVYKLVGPQFQVRAAFTGVAHWAEYAPADMTAPGATMWRKMPRRMLQKCATAQALRYAFPEELADVELAEDGPQQTLEVNERAPASAPQLERPGRTYDEVFESDAEIAARMAHAATPAASEEPPADADQREIERQRKQEGLL